MPVERTIHLGKVSLGVRRMPEGKTFPLNLAGSEKNGIRYKAVRAVRPDRVIVEQQGTTYSEQTFEREEINDAHLEYGRVVKRRVKWKP